MWGRFRLRLSSQTPAGARVRVQDLGDLGVDLQNGRPKLGFGQPIPVLERQAARPGGPRRSRPRPGRLFAARPVENVVCPSRSEVGEAVWSGAEPERRQVPGRRRTTEAAPPSDSGDIAELSAEVNEAVSTSGAPGVLREERLLFPAFALKPQPIGDLRRQLRVAGTGPEGFERQGL